MEMEKKLKNGAPRETSKEESSFLLPKETETSASDLNVSPTPAKKIRKIMCQEHSESTQDSAFLPSIDTEMSLSDVSISPAKNLGQQPQETTHDSSFLSSNETEMYDVPLSPAKKIRKIMGQQPQETTQESSFLPSKEPKLRLFGVTIFPGKNTKQLRQEQRETTKESSFLPFKEPVLRLFGVNIFPGKNMKQLRQEQRDTTQESCFLAPTECEMSLSNVSTSPAKSMSQPPRETTEDSFHLLPVKNMSQEPRVSPKEYLFLPSKEMEMEMEMDMSSASPMITDEEELTKSQTGMIKEMMFHSKEQIAEEKQYGVSTEPFTNPWIIEKELNIRDFNSQVYLKKDDVKRHILRYLTEDDQKKVREVNGVVVKVYDHDTDTRHEIVLKRFPWPERYFLEDDWFNDFINRRGLKIGDKIGLFWDRLRYELHFRVLSRVIKDDNKRLAGT